MHILHSSRLTLRSARIEGASALNEPFSDTEVMRYWSEPPHPDMGRTQAWIASMVASPHNGNTDFIICLKDVNQLPGEAKAIGKIGIYAPLPSNEIGFLLGRQYWGKGYAREALSLMLDHLFNFQNKSMSADDMPKNNAVEAVEHTVLSREERLSEWMYPSITADVDPRNAASIGLLKKVGFRESGFVKDSAMVGGELVDSLYLKLGRGEWLKRQNPDS